MLLLILQGKYVCYLAVVLWNSGLILPIASFVLHTYTVTVFVRLKRFSVLLYRFTCVAHWTHNL
jgi:hypothetical protein